MPVKAFMELSSRSDLVTQQDPKEEKIDRQTDTHGGETRVRTTQGRPPARLLPVECGKEGRLVALEIP